MVVACCEEKVCRRMVHVAALVALNQISELPTSWPEYPVRYRLLEESATMALP